MDAPERRLDNEPVTLAHEDDVVAQWAKVLQVLCGLVALGLGITWLPRFGGDALIHFSIMENAASGHWFQFNRGVPDPASTSMAWTVFGATCWSLGGVFATALMTKGLGYLSWLFNAYAVRSIAIQLGAARLPAATLAALTLAVPGTIYNSVQGMENTVFTSVTLAGLWLLARAARQPGPTSPGRAGAAFAVLGLAAAIRPEGVVVTGLLLLFWGGHELRDHGLRGRWSVLAAVVGGAAAFLPFWTLHLATTGQLVPGSGISRLMMARRGDYTLHLGELWVYGRPLILVSVYLPLFALAALGVVSAGSGERRQAVLLRAMGLAAAGGLALYVFVTGAVHASRYLIWVFSVCGILAAVGWTRNLSGKGRAQHLALLLAGLWLVGSIGLDTTLRLRRLGTGTHGHGWSQVLEAPGARKATTDRYLTPLCSGGCCGDQVPQVARGEVQLRFFLDERIHVVSLDGVTTGPGLVPWEYEPDGCVDSSRLENGPVAAMAQPMGSLALRRCVRSDWAKALLRGWGAEKPESIPGWRWIAKPRLLVRECGDRERPKG